MITHRVVGILTAAIVCALSATPGRAEFVTYSASGTITEADNAAQLPAALSAGSVGNNLSVDFTVDTSAPGTAYAAGQYYLSSVVSANASIGSGPVGIGVDSSQIAVASDYSSGGAYYSEWLLTSSSNVPSNFTGTASGFQLLTAAAGSTPLNLYNDTSLSNAPLQPADANALDSLLIQYATFVNGVVQSTSDLVVASDVAIKRVEAPELDATSAAGALTLLVGGLVVICGRRPIKVQA
jgi:hypothetical protein